MVGTCQLLSNFYKNNKIINSYQTTEERYEEIRMDLLQAGKAIKKNMGKRVKHLCDPSKNFGDCNHRGDL